MARNYKYHTYYQFETIGRAMVFFPTPIQYLICGPRAIRTQYARHTKSTKYPNYKMQARTIDGIMKIIYGKWAKTRERHQNDRRFHLNYRKKGREKMCTTKLSVGIMMIENAIEQ